MLPLKVWKIFLQIIQFSCGAVGILLNTILLLLIIFRSPKHLGAYKYLMIYISVFETFYCLLDADVEPHIFSYGPSFIVFRNLKHVEFEKSSSYYFIVVWCGTFGLSLALFAVHFIYRYGASDAEFRKKYLDGWKLNVLFVMPLVYGVWWSIVVGVLFAPSAEAEEFIRLPLLQGYDTQIENVSYVIVRYYAPDESNHLQPIPNTFIATACTWFMLSTSFFCVIYFGIKCYLRIAKALKTSKMASYHARSIQQQLFQALVVQTMIPLILMYTPVGVTFFFPMLNVDIGFLGSFVTATIAIYPAVDPLPTMFIVKSYRETLLCHCGIEEERSSGNAIELRNQNALQSDN